MRWVWALLMAACGEAQKPIVPPNPVAADCISDRTIAQLQCVKDAGSLPVDDCIARAKAANECVDGGAKAR